MNQEKTPQKIWNALLVIIFFNLIVLLIVKRNPDFQINITSLLKYKDLLVDAYLTTIMISIISLILSLFIGLMLFFMSISKQLYLKYFYESYTQIVLGVPLMIHIIVLYFFLISAIGIKSPEIAGILILSGYMAAYFAKIFEGAYYAIDTQQFCMMKVLQLPYFISMKKIILPQIIKNTLPALTSNFSLLIKSTALLSLISVPEFTNVINVYNSKTLEFVTGYLFLAVGYLIITIPLNLATNWLSKKVVPQS